MITFAAAIPTELKASKTYSLLLLVLLYLGSVLTVTAAPDPAGKAQGLVFFKKAATAGDFSSANKLGKSDSGIVSAPSFQFSIPAAIFFLVQEFLFPRNTASFRIATPLFTNSYFKKLFCALIVINAP